MKRAADGGHRSIRVRVPFPRCPGVKLVGEVWSTLPGKRWVARIAATVLAVAARARCNAKAGCPSMKYLRALATGRFGAAWGHGWRQRGVIGNDLLSRFGVEPASDPLHLRMTPRAAGEILELTRGVSAIQPGKLRCKVAIALTPVAVAGGTGTARPGLASAEGDQFAIGFERIGRSDRRGARGQREQRENGMGRFRHLPTQSLRRRTGSPMIARTFAIVLAVMTAACKPPPEGRHDLDKAAVTRGRQLVAQVGCTACHAFPEIAWPQGRAGPSLLAFDGRGPIAGALPNTPANVAAFVRNAPAVKPGSPMPAMPLSESEARDVAAYLHGLADD